MNGEGQLHLPTLPTDIISSSYVLVLKEQNRSSHHFTNRNIVLQYPVNLKNSESMTKISNCRAATCKCFAASSFCKAGFLGYSITSNTAKVRDFPGSFLILQLNYSCAGHTAERGRRTHTSRASSTLCRRAHLIAFLSSILLKYLQIVYDIDPLVLAILEVYLDSHREFSPASPGQVKRRFSANKW